MNHSGVIRRREGTVAGGGPSNLAAAIDDEAGTGKRGYGAQAAPGCWGDRCRCTCGASVGVAGAGEPSQEGDGEGRLRW
jgi:hypothetical protein